MRRKSLISKLEESASSVHFPTQNIDFESFKSRLEEIVDANLGFNARRSLTYCEYQRCFYVDIKSSLITSCTKEEKEILKDFTVNIKRTCKIDPDESLMPQLEKIVELQKILKRIKVSLAFQ